MAIKTYQWKASTRYNSTTTLSHGVTPDDPSWHGSTSETGSQTFAYWFRDANVMVGGAYTDANSSRVVVSVTDSWTASYDSHNNLTIHITTTVNSIVRDDIQGTNTDTPGRILSLYRQQGGTLIQSFTDNQVATAHTISGSLAIAEYTFTLAPGQNASRNSLFLHNEVIGLSSWDEISLGIEIRNPQPADYRPHKVWNGSAWMSHNRSAGALNIRTTSTWQECRTVGDGTMTDNPPYTRHQDGWRDSRLIGQE